MGSGGLVPGVNPGPQQVDSQSQNDEHKKPKKGALNEITLKIFRLPGDLWGFLAVCVICATCFWGIPTIIKATSSGGKTEVGLFKVLQVSISGPVRDQEPDGDLKLLEFWTPSEVTRDQFCNNPKALANEDLRATTKCTTEECEKSKELGPQDKWECSVSDKQVQKFEDALWGHFHLSSLDGLHRYREEGRGFYGVHKAGWWWEITVHKNFDLTEFARFYTDTLCEKDVACKQKAVYIQEISGSPGYKN